MNLTVKQRNGYTLVDILSDIGGLLGILTSLMTFFLNVWNYDYLESYLIS